MVQPALDSFLVRAEGLLQRLEAILPSPQHPPVIAPDWSASVAFRYRKRSSAAWGVGWLEPVRHVAHIAYADLKEVDTQKERFARNLAQFVAGRTANNVLLSGARGTGKSSLVKAALHAHAGEGLRLIEVDKADLIDLPDLVELVSARPERFIVFCDDLSFDEGEPGYKALKSMLDGTVSASGDNVLIVATSNRRHLLPEYHSDNKTYSRDADGELHPGEVVEEKISLSERFGLWISFYPFSQDEYLAIVAQWLRHFGVTDAAAIEAARPEALVWAIERGSRSGRVASQFARDHAGRLASGMAGGSVDGSAGGRSMSGSGSNKASANSAERKSYHVMDATDRPPVDVAVGVLIERDAQGREGRFLLTSRPQGKVYAGHWEFPGGKLEAGETVEAALRRELDEELGITIGEAQVWKVELMDYPHARVRLHFCKVHDWSGAFEMREGQNMAWQRLPVDVVPVLPGTIPVLQWLAEERGHAGPTHRDPD